jgi:hypothetical protein
LGTVCLVCGRFGGFAAFSAEQARGVVSWHEGCL